MKNLEVKRLVVRRLGICGLYYEKGHLAPGVNVRTSVSTSGSASVTLISQPLDLRKSGFLVESGTGSWESGFFFFTVPNLRM